MEEQEIIRYKGNFKKISKIIVYLFLIISIVCFLISVIINAINNYHIDQKQELRINYETKEQIKNEKDKIRDKKADLRDARKREIKSSLQESSFYYDSEGQIKYDTSKALENHEKQENAVKNDSQYKNAVAEFQKALEEYKKAEEEYKKAYQEYENYDYEYYDFSIFVSIFHIFITLSIISIIFYLYISKMEIIVTNTRVYGKKAFGKRVDLPFDTISAVGTSFLKGIDVGTSAGRIHFKGILNNQEIHTEISKLLNARQGSTKVSNTSTTEELTKYKNLLDTGVITQEEFDAKKKQLLDL